MTNPIKQIDKKIANLKKIKEYAENRVALNKPISEIISLEIVPDNVTGNVQIQFKGYTDTWDITMDINDFLEDFLEKMRVKNEKHIEKLEKEIAKD